MEFIETPTFTRLLMGLLSDDEYRELQDVLAENPSCGDIRVVEESGKSGFLRKGKAKVVGSV